MLSVVNNLENEIDNKYGLVSSSVWKHTPWIGGKKTLLAIVSANKNFQQSDLTFLFLNVCGLRSRMKQEEFVNCIKTFAFLIFVEMKTDSLDAEFFTE